ncbi:hypothetical protein [Pedobacter heparinus]|uniref:hypothetical protein n=1 Tax=Pedobacter heparinus TaxID=984 RepID=UPI00292EFAB9|nr:hypothetical protein [Pedobacter heparinus]
MRHQTIKQKWQGMSLIISATAMVAATFFMRGQEFTATGGIIMILTVPFSIFGFNGIFEKFSKMMPAYVHWGFLLYLFGAVATVNFGMRGVFNELFGITIPDLEIATRQHPAIFTLVFFAIGPAFPLSILLLGINLYRKKLSRRWIALLLILGAISFPPSRVSRVEVLMHLCDLLLFIPMVAIGLKMIKNKE